MGALGDRGFVARPTTSQHDSGVTQIVSETISRFLEELLCPRTERHVLCALYNHCRDPMGWGHHCPIGSP